MSGMAFHVQARSQGAVGAVAPPPPPNAKKEGGEEREGGERGRERGGGENTSPPQRKSWLRACSCGVLGKPIDPSQQKKHRFNWDSSKHRMKGHSRHNSSLIGRKYRVKFENDRISRNGHRIKTIQPNLMILVSFSFAEDVWSNDVNKIILLARNVLKSPPFTLFLGHPV